MNDDGRQFPLATNYMIPFLLDSLKYLINYYEKQNYGYEVQFKKQLLL